MVKAQGAVMGHTNEQAAEVIQRSRLISIGSGQYHVSPDGVSLLIDANSNAPYVLTYDQQLRDMQSQKLRVKRRRTNPRAAAQTP